ncbi:F178B protein, partial [Podilymbus podiceps]|nr:F178B protein [Podilymbus podiceps]
ALRGRAGPAVAPHPEGRRWYQIPLSSARVPRLGLFSYGFQAGLQRYQQLRSFKHLRVGRPVIPPPPGLLEPWPAVPSPADSSPRASRCPGGAEGVRGQQAPSPAQPCASPQATTSQGSSLGQAASTGPGRIPVLPELAVGALGGTVKGSASPVDSEEDELIPLKALLLAGGEPPLPAPHRQVACQQLDPLANSLDSLVREKREQRQAATPQASPAQARVVDASPWESPEEEKRPPAEHRHLLARFSPAPRCNPTVHPGEPIFRACLVPAPTLEEEFFCHSPPCQADFVRDGGLGPLCHCLPPCPLPILRWLFQLMTLCLDMTAASQALWEIWLSTGGKPWCPTVQEISRAFTRLSADLSPLRRQCLLPPELCPTDRRVDPLCSPRLESPDAAGTLALATQLGDICKFLALCVVTQPHRYADTARVALVTLLSFLGLDQALRRQPLPELRHLLRCLLEGVQAWPQQVPAAGTPL